MLKILEKIALVLGWGFLGALEIIDFGNIYEVIIVVLLAGMFICGIVLLIRNLIRKDWTNKITVILMLVIPSVVYLGFGLAIVLIGC